MYIKHSVLVFARFEIVQVFGRVVMLLNEVRYYCFDPDIEASLLTEERKKLCDGSVRPVN